jgi:cytochrome c oxidase cbb3-type subunit 4
MELYTFLRQFADSWVLLAMTAFFLGAIIWVFRPSAAKAHKDSASIPFRHEDRPAADPALKPAGIDRNDSLTSPEAVRK